MTAITVLWVDAADFEIEAVRAAASQHGATCAQVTARGLTTALVAALARGGVVYLTASDEDATYALGLGVDEVLRSASPAAMHVAIERTRVRAEARARREQGAHRDHVGITLSLIAGTLGHQLNNPLAVATLNCHSAQAGIDEMMALQERLSRWAALSMPDSEVVRLSTAMANAPTAAELRSMLTDAQTALERAGVIMKVLRRLSTQDERFGTVRVRAAIEDFRALFRPEVEAITDITIDVADDCEVAASRPAFVSMLTILFAHVYECARGPSAPPRIALAISQHDGALLIEVEHDGAAIPTDLRRRPAGAYFGAGEARGDAITFLQDRAQQLGGELLAQVGDGTTTLRLILPLAGEEAHAATGVSAATRKERVLD